METFETLFSRVSTRDFNDKEVSAELIERILQAGMSAPVGRARYDTLHITVVKDQTFLDGVTELAKDTSPRERAPFYGAKTLIVVSSKMSESPAIEYSNVACVIENMALAARALNVASVYLWAFVKPLIAVPELCAKLELLEGFTPVSALAIGYSDTPLEVFDNPRHSIEVNRI